MDLSNRLEGSRISVFASTVERNVKKLIEANSEIAVANVLLPGRQVLAYHHAVILDLPDFSYRNMYGSG